MLGYSGQVYTHTYTPMQHPHRVGSTVSAIKQRLVLATNCRYHKLSLLRLALDERDGRTLVFAKKKNTVRVRVRIRAKSRARVGTRARIRARSWVWC